MKKLLIVFALMAMYSMNYAQVVQDSSYYQVEVSNEGSSGYDDQVYDPYPYPGSQSGRSGGPMMCPTRRPLQGTRSGGYGTPEYYQRLYYNTTPNSRINPYAWMRRAIQTPPPPRYRQR